MKTPVTHDQMIKMFASYQDANIEIIRSMQTAVNATTKAETDRVDLKLDGVITRQDKVNGAIAQNIKDIALNGKTTERVDRIGKHLKWYVFGLFGFMYGTCWIYETFNIEDLILKLIDKI